MTLLPAAATSWRSCADGVEGKRKEEDRKTAEQARACSAVFGEKMDKWIFVIRASEIRR